MPIEDSDPKRIAARKRKEQKNASKARENASFQGFINANPNDQDKRDFDAWLSEEDLFSDCFQDALTRGYKFTVTYERNGDYFRTTAATWDGNDPNAGLVLSLRAGDALRSLARCVWWLSRKCDFNLGAPDRGLEDPDRW